MTEKSTFAEWVILELMSHRRLAGWLTEQETGGQAFLRLEVPGPDGDGRVATQFYSPSAVYCITPTTEDLARRIAEGADPAPVKRWELPAPERARPPAGADPDDFYDEDDDEDDDDDEPAVLVGPEDRSNSTRPHGGLPVRVGQPPRGAWPWWRW